MNHHSTDRSPSVPPSAEAPHWRLAAVAVLCFATGYFVADDSVRVQSLQAEIDRLPRSAPAGLPSRPPFTASRGEQPGGLRGARPTATPDLIIQLGLTPEELKQTEEINARQAQGEYILKLERPTTRKFLDHDFRQLVTEQMPALAERYDPVFAALGLPSETQAQLKTHLGKLQRADLELTVALQQVEEARQAYDRTMRASLSAEDYESYRAFEALQPAERELDRIQRHARETGQKEINETERARLAEMIHELEAYTSPASGGPYGAKPPPLIGAENILRATEIRRNNLEPRFAELRDRLGQAGASTELAALLENYHDQELRKLDRKIDLLNSRMNTGK